MFLAVTLSCSSSDPGDSRMIGVVVPGLENIPVIVSPDTVEAGVRFGAVINTFGSSGCTLPSGVAMRLQRSSVTITPFDQVASETTACTRDYAPRPHPVTLTFTAAGPAQIIVRGVRTDGTVPGRMPETVTKDLWVLPEASRSGS
jgi:hypothetical protein